MATQKRTTNYVVLRKETIHDATTSAETALPETAWVEAGRTAANDVDQARTLVAEKTGKGGEMVAIAESFFKTDQVVLEQAPRARIVRVPIAERVAPQKGVAGTGNDASQATLTDDASSEQLATV